MGTKIYNKLVRDRIPEFIEADGNTCTTEIMSDKQYVEMLNAKLNEEVAEYQESKSVEELADLLEVMQAVVRARGWTWEQLEQVRRKKFARRGGFEKKILLKEVVEQIDCTFLFQMRDYLEQTGQLYSTTLPKLMEERRVGKIFDFSEHLKGLIYALLSAQTKWYRIAPNLPDIDRLFSNYDTKAILLHKSSYYINGIKALKCGSLCTNRQMEALHGNIHIMRQIEEEFGSMDAYVTSAEPDRIVADLASGKHKLSTVGPALAWEYLRNVGIDGTKPDVHVCRFLGTKRMGLAQHLEADVDEAVQIVQELSTQTGMTMVEIDSIIWSYCADSYGAICTKTPKCEKCVVRVFCHGWHEPL